MTLCPQDQGHARTGVLADGEVVVGALASRAFPNLEALDLSFTYMRGHLDNLAAQLSSHALPHLRSLKLRDASLELPGVEALVEALGQGACPLLRDLDLSRNKSLDAAAGQALARAVRVGRVL
jgi:hypothetical protein